MKFDFAKMFYKGLDFNDPNIASTIAEHFEYKRLETGLKESIPIRGKPLLHQREIAQLFLFIQAIILIHSVGTGKTCAIVQSVEQFKEAVTSAIADYITQYLVPRKVPYKKFYILVKGPILEKSFKQQIICKCTAKSEYETEELANVATSKRKGMFLKDALEEYYQILGYTTIAGEIKEAIEPEKKNLSDKQYARLVDEGRQRLKAKYSNSIFVADEVHILTSDKEKKENKGRYKFIHELFHLVENCKFMLATASPMKNSSTEFADILNLILPSDNQVSRSLFRDAFPENTTFNAEESEKEAEEKIKHVRKYSVEEAKQMLLPYFRGKISFLRATDISVDIRDHNHFPELNNEENNNPNNNEENNSNAQDNENDLNNYTDINIREEDYPFYVTPVTLVNPAHIELYKLSKQKRYMKNSGVYNIERQIANVWLPTDGNKSGKLVSHEAFKKLFKETGMFYSFRREGNEKFQRQYLIPKEEGSDELPAFYNISPKAVECGEILLKVNKTKKFKKTVIYSNFRDMGVNAISICLMYVYGYESYNGEKYFDEKNIGSSYCTTAVERKLKKDITKKKRFAILFPRKDNEEILNVFNSYENRYGDYVEVLLVPQLGREGINTNEVQTFINVDGHWNMTNYLQAKGRVFRADAFLWSLQELRESYMEQGLNPDDARITVDVFNLAIFLSDEDRDPDDDSNDIDVLLYNVAIEKDIEIQKVMRFIKETAVDCFIHYNRNYRENQDEDGSPDCNYETCKYECAVEKKPTDKIVYDMYDLLYSKPEVDDAKMFLQKLFETRPSITYYNLLELMPEYRQIVIVKALSELILNRTPLVDQFGDNVYLREDNGTFFIQREYPTYNFTAPYAMSEYVYNTPLVRKKTLTQALMDVAIQRTKDALGVELKGDLEGATLGKGKNVNKEKGGKGKNEESVGVNIGKIKITDLDLLQKVTYLEELTKLTIQAGKSLETLGKNEYVKKYINRFYSFREPDALLTQQARGTAIWDKRGRKPENIDVVKINPLKTDDFEKYNNFLKHEQDATQEIIYTHALLSFEQTAEFERFSKGEAIIRVFKPSEGEWRDANPYEIVVYNGIMQVLIREFIDKLESHPFYGYMSQTNRGEILKIIDMENRPKQRTKNKEDKVDLRTRTKGVECEKFLEDPQNIERMEAFLRTQAKTCEEIGNDLESKGLLVYLFL